MMRKRIYELLLEIPKSKVTTYKEIAIKLGNKNLCRYVGNTLHKNPNKNKYPCYKVVNSKGELSNNYAFGGIEKQKEKLEKEQIEVKNYKVNLNKFLYKFNSNKK